MKISVTGDWRCFLWGAEEHVKKLKTHTKERTSKKPKLSFYIIFPCRKDDERTLFPILEILTAEKNDFQKFSLRLWLHKLWPFQVHLSVYKSNKCVLARPLQQTRWDRKGFIWSAAEGREQIENWKDRTPCKKSRWADCFEDTWIMFKFLS